MLKRLILVLSVLLLLSLACATFGGEENAGNTGNTVDTNSPAANTDPDVESSVQTTKSAACYNPFYPLGEDVSYTYQATYDGVETTEYKLVTVDETEDTITVQLRLEGVTSEVLWHCGDEGLFSSEYAQFDIEALGDSVEINTISYDGITLPTEEEWYVWNSWDMNYEIEMHFEVEGIEVSSHAIGAMVYEIVGTEEVTVPAGTYPDAYRVETTGTITTVIDMMDTSVTEDVDLNMTSWYVKGVGMVKQVSEDISGTSTTELISVE